MESNGAHWDPNQSVIWDPKEKFESIEPLLLELQNEFLRQAREKMPMTQSKLYASFLTFEDQSYNRFQNFAQAEDLSNEELLCMLEKRILSVAELENGKKLEEIALKNMKKFADAYNLNTLLDPAHLANYMVERIEETDDVLTELTDNLSLKKRSQLQQLKDIKDIDKSLAICLNILQLYLNCLFGKYELSNIYACKKESIDKILYAKLREKCRATFEVQFDILNDLLQIICAECLQKIAEIEASSKASSEINCKIQRWVDIYKSIKQVESQIFQDSVQHRLKFIPSNIFLEGYLEKIEERMNFVYQSIFALRDDFGIIYAMIFNPLAELFRKYYETKEINIFDCKIFSSDEIRTVFEIIVFSEFEIRDKLLWRQRCYPKIKRLANEFLFPMMDEFSRDYGLSLLSRIEEMPDTSMKQQLNSELEISKNNWREDSNTNPDLLLSTMFGVFIYFSNSLRENSSNQYRSFYRKMISRIFRNLSNGEAIYSNFQVLTLMECLHEEFSTSSKGAHNPTLLATDLSKSISTWQPHYKKKDKPCIPIIDGLKSMAFGTGANKYEKIEDQIDFARTIAVSEVVGIEIPSKFYIEKVHKSKSLRSKHIIVTLSGWTSEDMPKADYWKSVIDVYPFSEILAVHYESQTEQQLLSTIAKKACDISLNSFASQFGLTSLASAYGKILSGALTVANGYQKLQELKAETWEKAFKEAVKTGTYLAHVLNSSSYFKNKTVSFLGFSLGTMVIACCIWELERLKRYDLVYDVLLMGGIVNSRDFNDKSLSIVANELTNCYSKTDRTLGYILKLADSASEPIGLSELVTNAQNIKNHDFTWLIADHHDFRPNLRELLALVDYNEDITYLLKESE